VLFRKDGGAELSSLLQQRCVVHADREAAVRCPGCRRFYCRECVTEHLGRMMCAPCVARAEMPPERREASMAMWSIFSVTGLFLAWMVFYYFGMTLARVPSTFFGSAP
jgi:hypothetical protein